MDSDDPKVREQARLSTGLSMCERLIDFDGMIKAHRVLVGTVQSALEEAGQHDLAKVS